jgi:general secretion pathway protein F
VKPLPWRVRADIFIQLSQLERAGVPYGRAIATMAVPAPAARRLKAMQRLSARGIDAAKAGEQSGLFTRCEARLVGAALNAGSPAPTYQRLAEHYSQRARQSGAMKSRLMLPAFVLGLALLIQPLPALISGTIGVPGYAWQAIWPVLLILAIVAVLRLLGKSLPKRVPLYGPIFVRANFRDYFESLALMLEAGVPMLEALPAAIDTVSDGEIRRQLTRVRQRVEKGESFADALGTVSHLQGSPALALASTGEQSGTLPEMLMRHAAMETEAIASFYEQVADGYRESSTRSWRSRSRWGSSHPAALRRECRKSYNPASFFRKLAKIFIALRSRVKSTV